MENGNGKLGLSASLRAIRESLRKPDGNRLPAMRNDYNGLREFLLGGVRDDGIWPAGMLSVRISGDEILVKASIRSIEVEAQWWGQDWNVLWEHIDRELSERVVRWALDYKGRERLERRISLD